MVSFEIKNFHNMNITSQYIRIQSEHQVNTFLTVNHNKSVSVFLPVFPLSSTFLIERVLDQKTY